MVGELSEAQSGEAETVSAESVRDHVRRELLAAMRWIADQESASDEVRRRADAAVHFAETMCPELHDHGSGARARAASEASSQSFLDELEG